MQALATVILTTCLLATAGAAAAQDTIDDQEQLKLVAIEALLSAPPERALPLAQKVLQGNHSNELKERALFVLSQIDSPEAQDLLLAAARDSNGELRQEAIRMLGISGDPAALAQLATLYSSGSVEVRDAVLEAYLIADDRQAVYELAINARDEDEFGAAVDTLGAMGATAELRQLRDRGGSSESWIDALAVSGDVEVLRELALDDSDLERQTRAIEALGIVDDDVNATLLEIYRGAANAMIREAALNGLLIADNDQAVLELYRSSDNPAEKKQLLEFLVMMDSDEVWKLVDAALDDTD